MNTALTYQTTFEKSHGYEMHPIRLRVCDAISVAATAAGCVDNKAGYYDSAAATRIAAEMARLTACGVGAYYEFNWGDHAGASATINYQLFERAADNTVSYCEPRIEYIPSNYMALRNTMQTLDRIAKQVERTRSRKYGANKPNPAGNRSFADRDDVLAALKRMRAVQVVQWSVLGRHYLVPADSVALPEYSLAV